MTQPTQRHQDPALQHARLGLAVHVAVFVAVNLVLSAMNLRSGDDLWFHWPLLGWGVGLAWHARVVASHVGLRGPGQQNNT